MDLLTLAVDALRLHRARYRRDELSAPVPALVEKGSGLHLVESGKLSFAAAGGRVELDAGDLVLMPRALQRTLTPSGGRARVLSGEFEFSAPDHPLLSALPLVFRVPGALLAENPHFHAHVASLHAELEGAENGSQALVARLTEVLFIHAMRLSPPPSRAECPSSGWLRGLHDPTLQPVLEAMHGAPGHGWTLARLAKLAGQSRSAFAAHFTEAMGEPPMTYLGRWRMFRARSLLRDSELPLAAIAEQVGYGSSTAFSLAFTREHGATPGAFRAAARRSAPPAAVAYRPARS